MASGTPSIDLNQMNENVNNLMQQFAQTPVDNVAFNNQVAAINGRIAQIAFLAIGTTALLAYNTYLNWNNQNVLNDLLWRLGAIEGNDCSKVSEMANQKYLNCQGKLDAAERENHSLQRRLDESKTEAYYCKTSVGPKDTEIASFKKDLGASRKEVLDCRSLVNEKDQKLAEYKNDHSQAKKKKADKHSEELNRCQKEVVDSNTKFGECEGKLKTSEQAETSCKSKHEETQSQLTQCRNTLGETTAKNSKCESERSRIEGQLNELQALLDNYKTKDSESANKLNECKGLLSNCKSAIERNDIAYSDEIRRLQNTLDQCNDDKDTIDNKLKDCNKLNIRYETNTNKAVKEAQECARMVTQCANSLKNHELKK